MLGRVLSLNDDGRGDGGPINPAAPRGPRPPGVEMARQNDAGDQLYFVV
jgi:hypothetical protein